MRKLFGFLVAASFAVGLAVPSHAATLQTNGSLGVGIGALPPIVIPSAPPNILIAVSSGAGSFSDPAGMFSAFVALPTPLFTGVPLITSLNVTAANNTGTFTATGGIAGGFGGPEPLNGFARIGVLGLFTVPVPLGNVGGGGSLALVVASLSVTVIGNIFTTGPAVVTGVTTTLTHLAGTTNCAPATCGAGTTTAMSPTFTVQGISLGGGKLFANTITVTGFDNRTPGHQGSILLVSPIQIFTNAAGNLPGFVQKAFTFTAVPEPGTLLLLGSGVAGLAILGRRRMRK
jgi:hypothetical protein